MAADSVPDLLVLPHFFGAESDGALARAFCDRIGCLLHEDAAHLLQPVGTVGTALVAGAIHAVAQEGPGSLVVYRYDP